MIHISDHDAVQRIKEDGRYAAIAPVHDIYLEIGGKKVFACAVAWPGWCRSGQDAQTAVQALYDAAPRYAPIARDAGLTFDLSGSTETGIMLKEVDYSLCESNLDVNCCA